MSIYVGNYSEPNAFGHLSQVTYPDGRRGDNIWLAGGTRSWEDFSKDEEVAYSVLRQDYIKRNAALIDTIKRPDKLPLRDMAKYYSGHMYQKELTAFGEIQSGWQKVKNIVDNGTGVVYGWDTETVGDILFNNGANRTAGFTELGISRTMYQNGSAIGAESHSILLRLNAEQEQYAKNAINVLETQGYGSLDKTQKVVIDRLVRYANASVSTQQIDFLHGQFKTVSGLSDGTIKNVKLANAGLNFIMKNGQSAEEVLPAFVDFLGREAVKDNVGIVGANTYKFDIPALRNMIGNLGVDSGLRNQLLIQVDNLNQNTADLTMALRVIAAARGESIAELQRRVKHGPLTVFAGQEGTVGAMAEAAGLLDSNGVFHHAGKDSMTSSDIAMVKNYIDNKSMAETVLESFQKASGLDPQVSLKEDSIFLINNGILNKNEMDLASVYGDLTHKYSITNQYWSIDWDRTGTVQWTPEGMTSPVDRFVLSFKSARNGEDIWFSKSFGSEDDAMKFLYYKTMIFDADEVSQLEIERQSRLKELDFGRREYEKFFNPNDVSATYTTRINRKSEKEFLAKTGDKGGYASYKRYMEAYEQVSRRLENAGSWLQRNEQSIASGKLSPESLAKKQSQNELYRKMLDPDFLSTREGYEYIKPILARAGLTEGYDIKAFVGMYGKLEEEYEALKQMEKFIDAQKYDSNIKKTMLFHDMHEAFMGTVESSDYTRHGYEYAGDTRYDAFAIDLLRSDEEYGTIRANTTEKLAYRINQFYDNPNQTNIENIKNFVAGARDLKERGIITGEDLGKIISISRNGDSSIFNLSNTLSQALEINGRGRSHTNAQAELYSRMQAGLYQDTAGNYVDLMTAANQLHAMDNALETGEASTAVINKIFFNKGFAFTDESNPDVQNIVKELAVSLNLDKEQTDAIIEMFYKKTRNENDEEVYAASAIAGRKNIAYSVITQDNANAYLLVTDSKHHNQLVQRLVEWNKISNGEKLTLRKADEFFGDIAGIHEFKRIKKHAVGHISEEQAKLLGSTTASRTMVSQGADGTYERYVHPFLDVYKSKKTGLLGGKIKEAGTESYTAWRPMGGQFLDAVEGGNFEGATRTSKRKLNEVIKENASIIGNVGMETVDGKFVRSANPTTSDMMHAFFFNAKDLDTVMEYIVDNSTDTGFGVNNEFTDLLKVFNFSLKVPVVSNARMGQKDYRRILESKDWQEFRAKFMNRPMSLQTSLIDSFQSSAVAGSGISPNTRVETFDMHLAQVISNFASAHPQYFERRLISDLATVAEILPAMDNVLNEDYTTDLMFSAKRFGDMRFFSPSAGINRPVYGQQLNERWFNPADLSGTTISYLDSVGGYVGQLAATIDEYEWRDLHDMQLANGVMHSSQERAIVLPVKQMSNLELQQNWELITNSSQMNDPKFRRAHQLMSGAMQSVYQDSVLLAPALATDLSDITVDSKRLTFTQIQKLKEDSRARKMTEETLWSLQDTLVKKGDIIGFSEHGELYWTGDSTYLREQNIKDILENGVTVIKPESTYDDRKYFFGGSEKTIATSLHIDDELLARHSDVFTSKEEILEYTQRIFNMLTGAEYNDRYVASAITDFGIQKHLSGSDIESAYNLVLNEYRRAGKLQLFVDSFFDADKNPADYAKWNVVLSNNTLVHEGSTNDPSYVANIRAILNDVQTNAFGDKDVNKIITEQLKFFEQNDMALLELQSNIQNQIAGTKLVMDPRLEAVLRRRFINEYYKDGVNGVRDGVNGIVFRDSNGNVIGAKRYEEHMLDRLEHRVKSGYRDHYYARDIGARNSTYTTLMERISKSQHEDFTYARLKQARQVDELKGVIESIRYYSNPSAFDSSQVLQVDMDYLLEDIPAGSIDDKTLQSFIFSVDGEYSQRLKDLATAQKISLDSTFSLKINLSDVYTVNGIMYDSVVIPIFDVNELTEASKTVKDKSKSVFWRNSQSAVINFFNTYRENRGTPKGRIKIESSIENIITEFGKELQVNKKESMVYKTLGRYTLPNSTQILAQNEIAPIVQEMIDWGEAGHIRKLEYELKYTNSPTRKQEILNELAELYESRDNLGKSIAENIRNHNYENLELSANIRAGKEGFTRGKNGEFLDVVVINKHTLQNRLDFDTGVLGYRIYDDLKHNRDGIRYELGLQKFSITSADIDRVEEEIIGKLEARGVHLDQEVIQTRGLQKAIDDSLDLTLSLNNATALSKEARRNLQNRGLMETKRQLDVINDVFGEVLGDKYMSEVGVIGIASRPPYFAKMGTTRFILDDSGVVGDNQAKILGPIISETQNLDFDGDNMQLAFFEDASNVARKIKDMAHDVTGEASAIRVWEKSGKDGAEILAQLIEEGKSMQSQKISDIDYVQAKVLEMFDPEVYHKARSDYFQRIGTDIDNIDNKYLREAIELDVVYSDEMRKTVLNYNTVNGNFLMNQSAQLAAVKARVTKENIGYISSPAFKLHNAVYTAFSESTDDAYRARLANLYSYLDATNFDADKGIQAGIRQNYGMSGFLVMAEQLGIDTKHIHDGVNISNVTRFATGMSKITSNSRYRNTDNVAKGLFELITSLQHASAYKDEKEVWEAVNRIMNTSLDEMAAKMQAETDKDAAHKIAFEAQVRAMYELAEDQNIRQKYNNPLNNFKDLQTLQSGLDNISLYGTANNLTGKLDKVVKGSHSYGKIPFDDTITYLQAGDLYHSNKGYTFKGLYSTQQKDGSMRYTLSFQEVNLKNPIKKIKGKDLNFSGSSPEAIINQAKKHFNIGTDDEISFNSRRYADDLFIEGTEKVSIQARQRQARALGAFNQVFTDFSMKQVNGFSRIKYDQRMSHSLSMGMDGMQDGPLYKLLSHYISTINNGMFNHNGLGNGVIEMDNIYSFIRARNGLDMTTEDLVRQMNRDIVRNPQNYGQGSKFDTYDKVFAHTVGQMLGSDATFQEELNDYFALYQKVDAQKLKVYNQFINDFRADIYDIGAEEKRLLDAYVVLDPFKDAPEVENILKDKSQVVKDATKKMRTHNTRTIQHAEKAVYSMLGDEKSMNALFRWNKASSKSVVGFGKYIGTQFGSLSNSDIQEIYRMSEQIYKKKQLTGLEKYAYEQTMSLLDQYTKNRTGTRESTVKFTKTSEDVTRTAESLNSAAKVLSENVSKQATEDGASQASKAKAKRQAKQAAKRQMHKQKVSDAADSILSKINKDTLKKAGVVTASLAALGVANNLLHNQRNRSPLTPGRRPNGSGSPNTNGEYVDYEQPVIKAPRSKTVYTDKKSGLNFKVSAKTKSYIDDRDNGRMISRAGGGNATVNSHSDTSGVTDNWLALKFSELA